MRSIESFHLFASKPKKCLNCPARDEVKRSLYNKCKYILNLLYLYCFYNCYFHAYSKTNSRLNRLNQNVARKTELGKQNVLVSSKEKLLPAKACDNLMPFDDDTTSVNKYKLVPVVCRRWEVEYGCSKDAGGLFSKPDSQVLLHVPPEAVASEAGEVIHAAVCADVDRIRRVLQLPDDESVVSPLAEYWAGPDFRFQRPVTITLPHCLPTNFHPSLVRVYRVDHGQDGQPIVTRVRQGPGLETANADCAYPWEESGHYCVSSEGQISVYTDHFCGYVCTYCEKEQSHFPELVAMAYGSPLRTSNGRHIANVDVYIWDKRIYIDDFRKEHGIGRNGTCLGDTILELLDDVQNTKLAVRLETFGLDAKLWQHAKQQNGQLANPRIQERKLMRVLNCGKGECERKAPPMKLQWTLETTNDVISCDVCQCLIGISHVPFNTSVESVEWQHREQKEVYNSLSINIQLQPASVPGISTGNSQERHDDEVHLVLSKQEATRLEHAANQVGINIHGGGERKRRYASASTAERAYPECSGQSAPKRVANYGGASASTYAQPYSPVHGMHFSQLGTSAESYTYAPATSSSMSVVPYTPPAPVMRLSPSLAPHVTEVGLNQALVHFQERNRFAVIVSPDATLTPVRSRSPSPVDKRWQKVISMVSRELSTSGSKNLFLELGLQNFDSIERNFANHGIERINLECLIAWRQKFSGKATVERLKEVLLETVERRDIVDKIDIILNESRQEANGTNDDQSSR